MNGSIEKEDLETLAAQIGSQEALDRIIAMYMSKLPAELEGLRTSLDAGDLRAVRSSADRLKSSSGQLGASRLAVMLAGLEHAGRQEDAEAASRILAEVTIEAESARAELGALTNQP